MNELRKLIASFDQVVGIAYELSQQFDGVESTSRRGKTSTYYLAKMVPECFSLLRVLPGSRFTGPEELFDFPSFCSISRNLIEAANLHWYYCIEQVDEEQSKFRFSLYDFHDFRTKIRIGRFLNADESELELLESESMALKATIKNNSFFKDLLPEVQRQILKGRRCSEFNQTEIVERRGLDVEYFNGVYKLLSTNTHSTPSAINSMVHSRLRGEGLNGFYPVSTDGFKKAVNL